jgi:hypothetical protein
MTKLSHRQREAITLYFIEEKKYDEICTLYGYKLPLTPKFNPSKLNKTLIAIL